MRIRVLVAALAAAAASGSCGIKDSIDNAVEEAVGVIDRGIADITTQSTNWQSVLQRIANELPVSISATIRGDVQNLADRGLARAGTEIRCNVDFLGARAIAALNGIKAKLKGGEPPVLPPAFCQVVPAAIDLKLPPASWSTITLFGYDMDHKDANDALLRFFMQSPGSNRVEIAEDKIGRTTHYQITLNMGQMARPLYENQVVKIVSAWNGVSDRLPEVVVLPWEPVEQEHIISMGATDYMPPKVGRGDADFDTDSDDHTSLVLRAEFQLGQTEIQSRVFMHAREERSDWTEVMGTSPWAPAYTAPAGWRIIAVNPQTASVHSTNVTTHGRLSFSRPAGEIVTRFEVHVDRDGDEAGTWTQVRAVWRNITVRIRETAPPWAR